MSFLSYILDTIYLNIPDLIPCQGQNDGGWSSGVINRTILWNRVLYYFGEYIILSEGITLEENFSRKEKISE